MTYEVYKHELVVGDCAGVYVSEEGNISISIKAQLCSFGGVEMTAIDEDCDLVDVNHITPSQAYMLGQALLAAAKDQGIG